MDPHRKAFTSYSDARQEINILNLIQDPHIHIVKLVGVLLQPLSIVMECAPLGSLQNTLEEYSRNGVKIPLTILQLIIQQVDVNSIRLDHVYLLRLCTVADFPFYKHISLELLYIYMQIAHL